MMPFSDTFHPPSHLTFGASGLDRAAHLRGQPDSLAALRVEQASRVLPVWRGKLAVAGQPVSGLGWLPCGHPVTDLAAEPPIFLGLDDGAARFAVDISGWEPDDQDGPAADGFRDTTEQVHPSFPSGHHFADLRRSMADLTARDAELAATARGLAIWHAGNGFCPACGTPTRPVQAGWQRDCPDCGKHHFPRTDPVVIMAVTHGDSILVGRSPHFPEGLYSLLAGFVEPGETLDNAVRREVFEEAGIRVGTVRHLLSQPWPFPASLMIACTGVALSDDIAIDAEEIAEARWIDRQEMLDVFAGTHPQMIPPPHGAIARFVLHTWLADRLTESAA